MGDSLGQTTDAYLEYNIILYSLRDR